MGNLQQGFEGSSTILTIVDLLEIMMEEFVQEQGRLSSVAQLSELGPDSHLLCSRLLGDAVMKEGEEWPSNQGREFTPILSLNLTDLPSLPEPLQPYRWLSLFMDVDSLLIGEYPRGENWQIRLYQDHKNLKRYPVKTPQQRARDWTPRLLTWSSHLDILDWNTQLRDQDLFPSPWEFIRSEMPEDIYEWKDSQLRHACRTKVGGWPSWKQSAEGPSHPDEFVLQICPDRVPERPPFDLCDNAITYLGYREGEWYLETQTN